MKKVSMLAGVAFSILGLLGTATAAQAAPSSESNLPPLPIRGSEQVSVKSLNVEDSISPEIEEYLATLSESEKNNFVNTNLPASETMKIGKSYSLSASDVQAMDQIPMSGGDLSTTAANGCYGGRVEFTQTATFGNRLYTYYHTGGWCVSNHRVTSAYVAERGGQTHTIGWRYDGVVAQASGVHNGFGASYTQHKFVLGTGGWDVQTQLPCIRVGGGASTAYNYSQACGIYV